MRARTYTYYAGTVSCYPQTRYRSRFDSLKECTRIYRKRRTMTGRWSVRYYDKYHRHWLPCRLSDMLYAADTRKITPQEAKRIYRLIEL